jgi:two-component system osmolarity sensor histidine kinase EnvZ
MVMAEPPPAAARSAIGQGSLLARTNLTLAVSSLLIALVSIAALNVYLIEPIARQSANDEAALLVLSAQTWVELPPAARPYFELELAENHDLIISSEPRDLAVASLQQPYLSLVQDQLTERMGEPVVLLEGDELIWLEVSMGGHQLQIGFSPGRRDIQPLYVGIIIFGLGAAIVFLTSLYIVQRITRPLVAAAERVESFRGGKDFEPLPERGPRELVSLARNFNTMAREISALLSNRTTLLAGISHDLRTPLTRMRLALELLPDNVDPKLTERFERNLETMDSLIGDALRFVRGTGEAPQRVKLLPFIEDVVDGYDASIPFEVAAGVSPELELQLAPGALKRVLTNLISNAQQHGDGVAVRLEGTDVHVIDHGPGIPDEHKEQVFQPFFRLDSSRSSVTGGSGLGLAIVLQLCQAHGWRVRIEDPPGGGTDVVVSLAPAGVEADSVPIGAAEVSGLESRMLG